MIEAIIFTILAVICLCNVALWYQVTDNKWSIRRNLSFLTRMDKEITELQKDTKELKDKE